jgi:hypothetical protein
MQTILQNVLITFILILVLVFIDFLFGVAVALKNTAIKATTNQFDFKKFLNFLCKFVAPPFLVWLGLSGVSILLTWLAGKFGLVINLSAIIPISVFIDGSAAAILLVLGNSILTSAKELGLGSINTS